MEINNLLESANGYKALKADAARLAEKWSASGLLEGLEGKEKDTMSIMLENQAKQIVAEQSSTGTGPISGTNAGNEQWAGVALPLVRKVFAQISSKDFVSVQPMNLPSGLVFFLDFKYGNAVNGRSAGENMYGNVSTAGDKMTVADGDASGGLYGAGQFGYSIKPKTANTVSIDSSAGATPADVNFSGNESGKDVIIFDAPSDADLQGVRAFRTSLAGLLPEYSKVVGTKIHLVVDTTNATDHNLTYHVAPTDSTRGDFEDATPPSAGAVSNLVIPEINVELRSEAVVAKTRKLKAQWTPEFAQDLNAYHSIDAEAELTSLLSEYISMEIDLEILDMLLADAATIEYWSAENNKIYDGAGSFTTGSSDFYNTQGQWFQTLGTKVQKVSNKIHQKTLRGGANFLVCSPSVATILESIPGYAASTDGDQAEFAMGVQRVGQLNSRYKVYKNPYMTENQILLGFRGGQFLEAGAVYAPYVPLIMTPLVYDPTSFTPRKGIMTRYAKKMIRPEFYGKIVVEGLATV